MTNREIGHHFLARLGKKRLRPGGITATNWLIENGNFSKDAKVLEVACNMGTTSIELAQRFGCHITGIDMDPKVLKKAKVNISNAGLSDKIDLMQANAMKLPFPDNSFDIIINEAMLTMLRGEAKKKAIKEYFRVLKPGGCLLTHDVSYESNEVTNHLSQLSHTINVHVEPLQVNQWIKLFNDIGFRQVSESHGKMTLMSVSGMIKDEGFPGVLKIIWNGLKKENRSQFLEMYSFFNKTGKDLCYIAVCSKK